MLSQVPAPFEAGTEADKSRAGVPQNEISDVMGRSATVTRISEISVPVGAGDDGSQ
jgi:hypothetical protein